MREDIKKRRNIIQRGEVPKGYRKTMVGIIPENWEVKRLKNIGDTYAGLSGKNKKDFGSGKAFIPYKNIFNNSKIDINDLEYVNIEADEGQNKAKYGDIFFTTSSETPEEVGMSSVLLNEMEELYLNSFCFGYRLKDFNTLNPKFARYLFRSDLVRNLMNRLAQGSTRYNLSKKEVLNIFIPVPSTTEQQKIAYILSDWDRAIGLKEKLIEEKQEQKKGLMQNLLTGKVRLPGFEGEITRTRLKGNVKEVKRKNKKGEIDRILSVTNKYGFIEQQEQFDKRVASQNLSDYKIVQKGEFAYNPSRINVGSIDLLTDYDVGVLSPMYIIFKTNNKKLLSEYLHQYVETNEFYEQMKGLLQGSVRKSLRFDAFEMIKLFIPPTLKEQKAIAHILLTADKEIELLKEEVEFLKEQKKGLMQLLLTGVARVHV